MRTLLLKKLSGLILSYPKLIIATAAILTLVSTGLAVTRLHLSSNQDDLVSNSLQYNRDYRKFLEAFGDQEYVYLVIDSPDEAKAHAAIEMLSKQLREHPALFKEVVSSLPVAFFESHLLAFLPEQELEGLDGVLSLAGPLVKSLLYAQDIQSLFGRLLKTTNMISTEMVAQLLLEYQRYVRDPPNYKMTPSSFFGSGTTETDSSLQDAYMRIGSSLYLVLCMPNKNYADLSVISRPLAVIREIVGKARKETGVTIGVTGRPVLQADEMATTSRDMIVASIIAVVLVSLIFLLLFRNFLYPALGLLSLGQAIAWTFGLAAIYPGHLNLLSIVFAVILIGLGIDFAIHFLKRYMYERAAGREIPTALETSMTHSAPGIITGALTSAAAFAATLLTNFKGLSDLGFIASCGLLLCLTGSLTLLPALLVATDRASRSPESFKPIIVLHATPLVMKYPGIITGLTMLLLAGSACLCPQLRFENNLLKLQARGLESVETELKLMESSDMSTWYAAFLSDSLPEISKFEKALAEMPSVEKTESPASFLPLPGSRRWEMIRQLKGDLKKLGLIPPERLPELKGGSNLADIRRAISGMPMVADRIEQEYLNDFHSDDFRNWELKFLSQVRQMFRQIQDAALKPIPEIRDLPAFLRNKFLGKDGSYMLYAYPAANIWDEQEMERFVSDIRSVDPDVTGTPVQVYESARLMQQSFLKAALYCALVVLLLVFLDFRKIQLTLLAFVPLITGMLLLVIPMAIFDISLNLANFFAIPILIGIGIDNGVHIVHRYRERKNAELATREMTPILSCTSLTTAAGFGSLMIASHLGLRSLGSLMFSGMLCCYVASILVLPAILVMLERHQRQAG